MEPHSMFRLMKNIRFRGSRRILQRKLGQIVWQRAFTAALIFRLQLSGRLIRLDQSARAVIPTIITQLLAGREEIKLGSLTPTRDFNYVKDTAAGFIAIAESDKTIGQEINIATQREISIGDLAKEIIAQINPDAKIVCDEQRLRPEKSEVNRLLGANAKIKELTDWKQQYTFEQGIAETIAWIRQNMAAYKTDIYNV